MPNYDGVVGNNQAEKLNNLRWQKINRWESNESVDARASRILKEADETRNLSSRNLEKFVDSK